MARTIYTDYYNDGTNDHYSSEGTAATGVVAKYIPQEFSLNTLVQFYNESTAVQLCNTDYQGDIKSAGDSVVIRKDPTVTTKGYSVGEPISYEVPEAEAQTMYIDQFKYNSFQIDTIDDLQSDIGLENRFQEACKESMKQVVDSEMFNYMISGDSAAVTDVTVLNTDIDANNWGDTAGAVSNSYDLGTVAAPHSLTTDNIKKLLVQMNATLFEAKTKGDWFVMSPWVASHLKITDLAQADVTGDATGVIRTGLIGEVDGSKVYVTNNIPSFVDTTTGLINYSTILAGNSQFCSFASQITETQTLPIPDQFGMYYRSLQVYGRKIVQPTAAAMAIVGI